ncbi:MAG: hypothetical protein M3Z16_08285, partial [Pseudomonadota bacterium]|nr:hypothetical protein [Pseudomonadota bacterium]
MPIDAAPSAMPAGISAPALGGVFEAIGGLRNRPAIVALLGCLVGGVLVGGLFLALSSVAGTLSVLLAALIYLAAVAVGVNAAGLLQMDRARGQPLRPLADALATALLCLPKLLVLALALFAVAIGVFAVLALLFVLCKIPFLGPFLYVVVFPASVVIGGLTLTGISVCLGLSMPAIWSGATLGDAMTQTFAIIRSRLVETLVLLLLLGLICLGVSLVVFGILGFGMAPALSMSISILGFGGNGGMASLIGGAGGGIAVATFVGASLLWAGAGALVGQVYLLGLCLVYLRVSEDLDVSAAAVAWRAGVDAVRARSSVPEETDGGASATGRPTGAAPQAPPIVEMQAAVPPAVAPVPVAPLASFEAMQSAAFGGAPAAPKARTETTAPQLHAPS